MKRNQVEAAFDELEASNPLERARIWLKANDEDGSTVSINVFAGDYDLFMDDELLVTRYSYEDGTPELYGGPRVRHIGASFVPFDSILLVELIAEEKLKS